MRSHTCSAHPLLVKLMEANGYISDEQYWSVMTSLGFDKETYSLRDENEEVKNTTHATRRRGMIISHLAFLAERRAQRAEEERKVAANAAAKVAIAAKREADKKAKAANAEARAETKRQKVRVAICCVYVLTNGGRFHTLFPHSDCDSDQEAAAAAKLAAGTAEKIPAASKKRKAPAKAWRCGNSYCKVEANDDEAAEWTACSKCDADLWFCPDSKCQAVLRSHERGCKQESEEA